MNNTLSPLTTNIMQMYTEGKSRKDIAFQLGMTQAEVAGILAKPEIQSAVTDIIKTTGDAIVAKNLGLIEDIISDKLAKLKTDNKDMSSATSKDIVDLMSIVNSMMVQRDRLDTTQDGNTYISILNGILK